MRAGNMVAVLLAAVLMFAGCAAEKKRYVRGGKEYGVTGGSFRGRWWNYYERGRSFADGRFYREAEQDFKKAIAGRGRDQWRARTYGMHFVDYFPHRELGVVYFQGKQYDLAVAELEQSVQSAPSAKGHYFLNKARAAQLRRSGRDTAPPRLSLEDHGSGMITNGFVWTVRGAADDDTYVASIEVGKQRVPLELALPEKEFSVDVALETGHNSIPVTVTDLTGKQTVKTLEISCDRRGPLIEILSVESEGDKIVVRGVVSDESGLQSLQIDGSHIPPARGRTSYDFVLRESGAAPEIVATDRAGNTTHAVLEEEVGNRASVGVRLALLDRLPVLPGRVGTASDGLGFMLSAAAAPPPDMEPPFIRLEELESGLVTYEDSVLLEGKVVDFSAIDFITINGEPINARKGRTLYFSQLRKLKEGDNEFIVVAIDTRGNRSEKKIVVTRKVQNIRQVGERMSLAVLPFEHRGEEALPADLIHDQMIDSFLEQKRFRVIERQKIDAVLRELQLGSSGLVDPDQAVRLGRIVAANGMLTGTVIESPDSVEIIGRLIDTETATVLASNDIFGEGKSFADLGNLLDGLAFKFKRDFPLFEGILIEVRGDEVVLDIGSEKRIKPNLHLICYREGPVIKHPVTGKVLGSEPKILGELIVSEVYEGFSKARLAKRQGEVKMYDRVIAR